MEFETINMLYNGNYWDNIVSINEMNQKTLHVISNDKEYRITAEEDYRNDYLHKYRPYVEKLSAVNINNNEIKVWTPCEAISEYRDSVEECMQMGLNYINSNQI